MEFVKILISAFSAFKGFIIKVVSSIRLFIQKFVSKELISENKELKLKLDKEKYMVFDHDNNIHWNMDPEAKDKGPFCSNCLQIEHNIVNLWKENRLYRCPKHGYIYPANHVHDIKSSRQTTSLFD